LPRSPDCARTPLDQNSAQSEHAHARMSPKTCVHDLFPIKGVISGQIDKNKSYKGKKLGNQKTYARFSFLGKVIKQKMTRLQFYASK
jgi:hypothetical protein